MKTKWGTLLGWVFTFLLIIFVLRYIGALLLYFFPLSDPEQMKRWQEALASTGPEWWLLFGMAIKTALDVVKALLDDWLKGRTPEEKRE